MLYLFGDQTFDVVPHKQDIISWRKFPLLASFLEKSHQIIQKHLLNCAGEVRSVYQFRSIDDILEWKAAGNNFVPLHMAMVCFYQLGTILQYPDTKYDKDTLIIGLCTGSFAATAFSCSRKDSDLVTLGMEAISAAFKTGVLVLEKGLQFEGVTSLSEKHLSPAPWASVVFGPDPGAALNAFLARRENYSQTLEPYVSAILPGGVTISGTPSSLAQLRSDLSFQGYKFIPIPVFGPYHHAMYADLKLEEMTAQVPPKLASRSNDRSLLLSKGIRIGCQFERLLVLAVEDVLIDKLHTPNLVRGTKDWLAIVGLIKGDMVFPQRFFIETIGITVDHPCYKGLEVACLSA